MRVFQIQDDWGFDNLKLGTRPEPRPGPAQVLVRMKASSVNFRDLVVPEETGYLVPVGDRAAFARWDPIRPGW